MRIPFLALATALLVHLSALAQAPIAAGFIVPNRHFTAHGIAPIPAALAARRAGYNEFRPRLLVGRHRARRELLLSTRGIGGLSDERDPAMRAFMQRTAPIKFAHRIAKPLFIVQGKNDRRVPLSESRQMVAKLRGNGGRIDESYECPISFTLPFLVTRPGTLIEFDPGKHRQTLLQRGLDFKRAVDIFNGPADDLIDARFNYGELRMFTFGKLDGRYVIVVWTPRGGIRRIISMRYANDREIAKHAHRVGANG